MKRRENESAGCRNRKLDLMLLLSLAVVELAARCPFHPSVQVLPNHNNGRRRQRRLCCCDLCGCPITPLWFPGTQSGSENTGYNLHMWACPLFIFHHGSFPSWQRLRWWVSTLVFSTSCLSEEACTGSTNEHRKTATLWHHRGSAAEHSAGHLLLLCSWRLQHFCSVGWF